eukprot:161004_1
MAILFLLLELFIICNSKDIEPWTTNSSGEYYLFHSRPTDVITRNLTCHTDNCIIQCNEEESCQKFNMHGSNTNNINLTCDYPEQKELRPGSCWRSTLFTQNANNINIYCTNENCAEAKFYVNKSNYSNITFNGDWAGKAASIFGPKIQNNLTIICNDSLSCSDIQIHCPQSSQCNINCNGTKACYNSNIYLGNNNLKYLNLNCNYSDTSCQDINIHCLDNTSNKLWFDTIDNIWKCFYKSNCCPFKHEHTIIKCEHGKCVINCDEYNGCNWGVINAENAKSLTVICNKRDQCKLTTVYCPTGDNANCNIICNGKESCRFMNVSSPVLAKLDLQCNQRSSCQDMYVNITVNSDVSIECNDQWSCANARFYIKGVELNGIQNVVRYLCKGKYSCEGIDMYCAYGYNGSCLLRCSDHDSSCGGVHIFAAENYQNDYLQIECPVKSKSVLKPCNFMKVSCGNQGTVLRCLNDKWKCSNDKCCPWIFDDGITVE